MGLISQLALAAFVLLAAASVTARPREVFHRAHDRALKAAGACSSAPLGGLDPKPTKASIFNELTKDEIYEVITWMLEEYPGLEFPGDIPGVNNASEVSITTEDNYIYRATLMNPPKKEALAWLDGKGPKPKRYAKVVVVRGAAEPRDVMEFKVGPLPLGSTAKAEALWEDGFVPYVKKPEDGPEYGWMDGPVGDAASVLKEVFYNMTGSDKCYGPDEECGYDWYTWWSQASLLEDGTTRISNVQWWFKPRGSASGNEFNAMPLPLFMRLNHTAPNSSDWFVFDIVYCNQGPWDTAEDFLDEWESGSLKICDTEWGSKDYDFTWARTDIPRGPRVEETKKTAGPRTIWPEGQRFALADTDAETGRSFSWMGWTGHVSIDPYTGFQLYDIKFRGQRIVYELAIEELYANYAGYGIAGQVSYFDSIYGIGTQVYPLRAGVDCPEGAAYMGVTYNSYTGKIKHVPNAVCFFEDDLATSDWRHTHGSAGEPFITGVRSTDFVIRMVTTPGNYDYVQSMRFRMDGSIEVDLRMGGYMSTAYWDPKNGLSAPDKPYFPRVQEWTAGVLHDHLALWKVDMDVLGTKNKLVKKTMKFGSYEDAGVSTPEWGYSEGFKYMSEETIKEEGGWSFSYQAPSVYQIQSNETNKWGMPRAYAVAAAYTTSQLLPESHPLVQAQYWTSNHIWATKQKDAEEKGHGAIYDYHSSRKPLFSMKSYVDGESIDDEDLVIWVTGGVQHVPRSEDLPLITNHGTHFMIKPWNFLDELGTIDVVDKFDYDSCTPDLGDPKANAWSLD